MNFDWFTFAAQLINFLVLLYLLKRFLYAPITTAMKEREERIAARMAEANRKEANAEQAAKDFRRRSEELEGERNRLFEQAKTEVEEARRQLFNQARADVDDRRQDWLSSLNREQATLSQMVRQRCSHQVTAATRQAIHELADADLEEQMLRSFIQNLGAASPSNVTQKRISVNGDAGALIHTAFEISPTWHDRLKSALTQHFSLESIEFRVTPDIICGIEVHIGAQKIGWSVEEYLATLEDEFNRLLEQPTT